METFSNLDTARRAATNKGPNSVILQTVAGWFRVCKPTQAQHWLAAGDVFIEAVDGRWKQYADHMEALRKELAA